MTSPVLPLDVPSRSRRGGPTQVVQGWHLEVERGPNWLFVKVKGRVEDWPNAPSLADRVWSLLGQHITNRLVLELDGMDRLSSRFARELLDLYEKIYACGGVLRLCASSPRRAEKLHRLGLADGFPVYRDREEAVFGYHRPR
jgi:anti-anti-sigma regulatory factor